MKANHYEAFEEINSKQEVESDLIKVKELLGGLILKLATRRMVLVYKNSRGSSPFTVTDTCRSAEKETISRKGGTFMED